ncbi:MAG: hypothetical protein DI586_05615 [Micavibrio aeruginosavorus]|uniref:Membrane protein 6-pyruvoyl-tetrahydropterin synthase-related domain-containing protein n=1 Tax=Micavibrio aeruginosavorus TaxID=349221 RepID=A0A2W5FIX8_9BACT|nr:MAG: hypothetical protein DI586_05615 [Micavibrio aeruginosavorus]
MKLEKLHCRLLFLAGLAIIISFFLPAILLGAKNSYDIRFHVTWFISFREMIDNGVLYPRWMPDQFLGFGAPTMFFYPPLTNFFYLILDFITFRLLPTDHLLGIAGLVMSLISGATFYLWIKNFTDKSFAVFGSMFYAIAPYHLMIDFYGRGAMAEYAAYMFIPLIFAGIYHVIKNTTWQWISILTLSITALFFTHLLTALIIAPAATIYALLLLKDDFAAHPKAALPKLIWLSFAGITGVGIAAIYFLPAVTLMDNINLPALQRYKPQDHWIQLSLKNPSAKNYFPFKVFLTATLYLAFALYLYAEMLMARKNIGQSVKKYHAIFFTGIMVPAYLLMCGMGSFVLAAPSPYSQIQFAWRVLVLVEFAMISGALILCRNFISTAQMKRVLIITVLTFAIVTFLQMKEIFAQAYKNIDATPVLELRSHIARLSSDEYLPAGTTLPRDPENIAPLKEYLAQEQAFITSGQGEIMSFEKENSLVQLSVDAASPVTITVYQFYFPGWIAQDGKGQIFNVRPEGKDKFISFDIPAGKHEITVSRTKLPIEETGKAISIISLLVFAIGIMTSRSFLKREKTA